MTDNNNIPPFKNENEFEKALVKILTEEHGWKDGVLQHKTEEDLVKNWASILYKNNCQKDRLDKYPLTESEMQQVIDAVNMLKNPFDTNRFINGCEVQIKRDNPKDVDHLGKETYLKIFDSHEIASGKSIYQIVRQPKFKTADPILGDRRGDVMLLINGMPVIHIELKRTGVDVSQAVYQIKRYTYEGVFSRGIFSLVQIFVAMTPERTLYFANPGKVEMFNECYWFHWEDFNNIPMNDWRQIATHLLSIPMAHQLVGYYTIADEKDTTLKVLRSYQYYAVTKITDKVNVHDWNSYKQEGGYIWHTTGSGKTMTSFKAAQLIANTNDADKVIFMMDRIELGVQSLDEYKGFAGVADKVSGTENTDILVALLKSDNRDDKLIVTSIQKMSILGTPRSKVSQADLSLIADKRIVIIVDECHRDVFGKMLIQIKHTFPKALFFGFTGTPIFDDKNDNEISTETIFGEELHRYSITDGLNDKNVLGFDRNRVETYQAESLRRFVALLKAGVKDEAELENTPGARKKYNHWMLEAEMKAVEEIAAKEGLYKNRDHHEAVVSNIIEHWNTLSLNGKFHAMLAVKSIKEAIDYYDVFKEMCPELKVTSVFNDDIDNDEAGIQKEQAIVRILKDYKATYNKEFKQDTYHLFKKDVQKRLAHKAPYIGIEGDHTQTLDVLIVVSQMLTGYDSKWVNTLYVDKLLDMHNLIQGFSRTNRLFGPEKPFGIIKYYDCPHIMDENIKKAVDTYSGNRPFGIFVEKLEFHLNEMNRLYQEIYDVFNGAGIQDFVVLPSSLEERRMFAIRFNEFNHKLEAARLQGFEWDVTTYHFTDEETGECRDVVMQFSFETYVTLIQRYRELFEGGGGGGGSERPDTIPIEPYITETSIGTIDAEYMNTKFIKYVKQLYLDGPGSEASKLALAELHKCFASLSQKNQKSAILILHAIQSGDLRLEVGKSIMDYIAEYQDNELGEHIRIFSEATGVNASQLRDLVLKDLNEQNFNDFGRFDQLRATADNAKLLDFTKKVTGDAGPVFSIKMRFAGLLKSFVISDSDRALLIKAYMDGVTIDEVTPDPSPEEQWEDAIDQGEDSTAVNPVVPDTQEEEAEEQETTEQAMARRIKDCLNYEEELEVVLNKPMSEIIKSVFKVLSFTTKESLDGVNMDIMSAITQLYISDNVNFVIKHNCAKTLVSQFEPYLKKLYFLLNGKEVRTTVIGWDPSMTDTLKAHPFLWGLKHKHTEEGQRLYNTLRRVVEKRNLFAHNSPILAESELDKCIRNTMVMYFYTSGATIDDIEQEMASMSYQYVADDSNIE